MPREPVKRTGSEELQAERRKQILDAAATVFAQRGFHRARTRDIAVAAGVAEGTIFNYFPTKRDLLFAIIERLVTESVPPIVTHAEGLSTEQLLKTLAEDRYRVLETNMALFQAVAPELVSDRELRDAYLRRVIAPMLAWLAPLLRDVMAPRIGADLQPRVVLPAIVGGLIGAYLANKVEALPLGRPVSPAELAEQLARFYARGLQAPPEPERDAVRGQAPSQESTTSPREVS
ncbi:MAG: TetR/AcrR family transcriptional regulator [Chloroflexota bacterium]